ncbi:MAG: 1-deoxy-D-xylulose-5-phosphate synthase [Leptospiraceae bacterium]|nr:1-deoxy-D-xylulose-5-phosphate synthase [Leptospiraceae bacterium]MCP5513450.1 1-deoxy-D-xylulose-5-phosphate synthase [Leptospiraceae bacterium]
MHRYDLLRDINDPSDLRKLPIEKLPQVCHEIRDYIIDTLSNVGGHFASNLGAVELTVAIHYAFNTPEDRLIWDVGHQTYPHKILTNRKTKLNTVRKFGGISGFPKREESEYDLYNTGHAGTSISQLLGEAVSRDMTGGKYHCLAVIGDASIACGMALEALNHGGHIKPDCLVILNDNFMSISKNIGSISTYLNNIISSHIYNKYKRYYYTFLKWFPLIGPAMFSLSRRLERLFKVFWIPGGLFEDLGFRYIGPVDGHNVIELVQLLTKLKNEEGPLLFHVLTQKGKGYSHAENDPIKYHGVTPFHKESGTMNKDEKISFSQIVGDTLIRIVDQNKKIAVITPAMIEGSGLKEFSEKFPDNLFDVGIAEQHCVTFASGLLGGGVAPFVAIYSTFMTRALDQMVHDVSLMNLPVRFIIDRAGVVGPDGETHQGLFDLGYLTSLPNMNVYIPSDPQNLVDSIYFMEKFTEGPIAIRFPKDSADRNDFTYDRSDNRIEFGKSKLLKKGNDITLICAGAVVAIGLEIVEILKQKKISVNLIDLQWLRPLDTEMLNRELSLTKKFMILDESYLDSGLSGYILNRLDPKNLSRFIKTVAFPPEIIPHGSKNEIFKLYGFTSEQISELIEKEFKN